jgi:hypothetical protein
MADPDTLTRWLRAAAFRLRLRRALNQLGWLGTGMCVLVVLYASARLALPPVVVAALVPLLLLAGIAIGLAFCWHAARRPSLQDTAAAADREAGLHDEVRSAYWFAQADDRPAPVALLLRRAGRSLQSLDVRKLFPLWVPPSLWAASVLAVLAGALLAVPPDIALSQPSHAQPGIAADSNDPEQTPQRDTRVQQRKDSPATPEPADELARGAEAAWRRIDALSNTLPPSTATGALQRAIASRDRQAVRQAAQALRATLPEAAARPEGEQLSADVAQGILERLESLLAQDGGAGRPQAKPDTEQPTARLTQQLREDVSEAHRRRPGQQSQGETALNTLLRAMARNSLGPSEAVRGEGETAQEGGQGNLSGGAMGRRVGVSRAGEGDEDAPAEGNPEGDAPADAVLGEATKPLEIHLQKAQVDGDLPLDQDGTQEDFYAATHGQAAGVEYDSAARTLRSTAREATTRVSRTPLAYDAAVKGYSLSQHLRDAPAREPK